MRISRLAVLLLLVTVSLPAAASYDDGCWNRDLQRMDYWSSPPQGGDQAFFSQQVQAGVVVLLYPFKSSLTQFPISLYEIRHNLGGTTPTGCTNTFLNSLQYALPYAGTSYSSLAGPYSASKTYPDPEPAYAANAQPASDGLKAGYFYRYGNWTPEASGTYESTSQACQAATSSNSGGIISDCQTCLNNYGYWLNPQVADNDVSNKAAIFSTNWLRFYPLKWSILKLAYKRMVAGPLLATMREGVMENGGGGVAGVVGNNKTGSDGVGGWNAQQLLPNSCQGQGAQNGAGILSQKLAAVESGSGYTIGYTSTKNPIAEMLFNDAWYQSGLSTTWCCSSSTSSSGATLTPWFSNSAVENTNILAKGGPCPGCAQNFIVIFSDGRGDTANPYCTPVNGVLPGPCQAAQQCNTVGMGEGDGDNFLDPSWLGGAGTAITGSGVKSTPSGTCAMDFADDVAAWMATHDMDQTHAGSNVYTYVVGIGSNTYGAMNILPAIAKAGKGDYIAATDFASFETALDKILTEIIQQTTSFSVPAVTTVQTRGTTYAFIPRFQPSAGNTWGGKLYRFNLFNEFAAGCTSADYGVTNARNPNGNNSCTDIYLTDANGNFVGDDSDGNIVLLDTSKPYPWPPMPRLPPTPPGTPQYATPLWEASKVLNDRVNALNSGSSTDQRTLYTVYDANNDGKYDTMIPFDTASSDLTILTPLLKLGGVTGTFCQELAAMSNHTYTVESDCAADLINFIRGQDILLQNPLNTTNPPPTTLYARPNILGDIFHSSPIQETPPVTTFLCNLGVVSQCGAALYSGSLTPGGTTAYSQYQQTNQYRTEALLVGANDGMLHAFNSGNDKTGDDPTTPSVEGPTNHYFDGGTGREMWAFIPPDLLPKLRLYAIGTRHEMFVDGTTMVRDVWVDGSGSTSANHQKEADEFHTVAIMAEREGGRGYTALDITDPNNPKFLWAWPPAGTTDSVNVGQSWDDFAPSPPPIGPIAVADTAGPLKINGTKASERWVVALGGGFDENLVRGAGYYLLDVWTGAQVFRASRDDFSALSTDPRKNMFPVAAVPSLIDINQDGLFDTLTVGDTMGQIWVSNFSQPGADTNGDGIYDNWYAARAFVEFNGQPLWHRSPFFQMISSAILPSGDVRLYLGSGNRDQIKDPYGGECEISDVLSCMRMDCAVDVQQSTYQAGSHYATGEWKYASGTTTLAIDTYATDSSGSGDGCSDTASTNISTSVTCGSLGTTTWGNQISCNWGTPECTGSGKPDVSPIMSTTTTPYTPSFTMESARFYSIHLYDNVTRAPFSTLLGATTYDAAALTDASLVNANTTTASSTAPGFYLQYTNTNEKTASQALVFAGCTFINTLLPSPPQPTTTCGQTLRLDTAYTYQADAITGAIQCGTGATATTTSRYTTTSSIMPPPMPTPVLSVNSTLGQVTYGGVSMVPGSPPTQVVIGGGDVIGPVEWLEVPKKLHDCRHSGINCK